MVDKVYMIIFLHGPDAFRSRQKLKELKNKFIKDVDASGINMQTLDGNTASPEAIENALITLPFLAKKRMVIIENILTSKRGEKSLEVVVNLIEKKSLENTIVIFWEEALDARKFKNPFVKKLLKEKYLYSFELLSPKDLLIWVQNTVKNMGGTISLEAAQFLCDAIGNNLWEMHTELEKLANFKQKEEIVLADIRNLSGAEVDENIFGLTDAIGNKNKKSALSLVQKFLSAGMSPSELLHKCLWLARNLLMIKSFMQNNERASQQDVARELGLHPFIAKKSLSQIKNFDLAHLKTMHEKILNIESKIKTGHNSNLLAYFDLLVLT